MSARRVVPEPWAAEMVQAGFRHPSTGEPSITALALESGVAVETVRRLVYGMGAPSEGTMRAVAAALDIPVPTVRKWAGSPRGESDPYSPPLEADRLNERQRKALDELIRATTLRNTDILLTFKDGSTLAVELSTRGSRSAYDMTGAVAEALGDFFAGELSSLVIPDAHSSGRSSPSRVHQETPPGAVNLTRLISPVTHADDLVDEVHEAGVPSPELIDRAAAHEGDEDHD